MQKKSNIAQKNVKIFKIEQQDNIIYFNIII